MSMRIRNSLLLAALAMVLHACVVGRKYEQPKALAPAAYTDSTATIAGADPVKWFDLYQDPALQQIIRTVLDSNRNLMVASARIEEARAQAALVRANLLPSLGYSAAAGAGVAGADARRVAAGFDGNVYQGLAVLDWEIDVWGRLRRTKRSALATFEANTADRNALQVSLVAEAAQLYFLLRDLDNRLLIAQRTQLSRKANTDIIAARYDTGYVAELDLLQARQQENIAAATIPLLQRQIVRTQNSLCALMGLSPRPVPRGRSLQEQDLGPAIPVGLPSTLLQRRPDLVAAERRLQSQFERIGIAQASMYPTLRLTGALGYASPELATLTGSEGFVANGIASLVGPLFQFGQNRRRVEVERQRTEQVSRGYEQAVINAFAEVESALNDVRMFAQELERRDAIVIDAVQALRLSKARYDYGYTSYLEVLIQESALFEAELQRSAVLQQKLNATVLLYKALGGGW
jgi:outer membrane protein, multidrug efflux system